MDFFLASCAGARVNVSLARFGESGSHGQHELVRIHDSASRSIFVFPSVAAERLPPTWCGAIVCVVRSRFYRIAVIATTFGDVRRIRLPRSLIPHSGFVPLCP